MKYNNPRRIALWSGPRNLSTAMMRSFGARTDTMCADEPFYAAYLAITGLKHPMRNEILAAHENDPNMVIDMIAHAPADKPLFYQKHMCHHMVDSIDRDWMQHHIHAFLIRRPELVLASYAKKTESVSLDAIAFVQQYELFRHVTETLGQSAIVIDSDDILANPPKMLQSLCTALDIPYQREMLSWDSGIHAEDGIWASHWYGAVIGSTGFRQAPEMLPSLPDEYAAIADAAMPYYEALATRKLG